MTEKRQPWMKFFPADWRAEPALRMCSRAARSLWLDLMGLMHEADPYGFLLVKGKVPTDGQLVSLLGDPKAQVERLRGELAEHGVFSRVGDDGLEPDLLELIPASIPAGTIFSRRMVRDAAKAATNRRNGKEGGNPTLVGERKTEVVNPPDKAQRPETRDQRPEKQNASVDPIAEEFERWYPEYPLKKSRQHALRAFRQARGKTALEILIQGAIRYRNDPKRKPEFTKHPATWLNGECWLDEAVMPVTGVAGPGADPSRRPSPSQARAESDNLVDRMLTKPPAPAPYNRDAELASTVTGMAALRQPKGSAA